MKVAHPTGNNAHQFQGQKVKGQDQQVDQCVTIRYHASYYVVVVQWQANFTYLIISLFTESLTW